MISVGMYYMEKKLMGCVGENQMVWVDNYYGVSRVDIRDNLLQ